VLGNHALQSEQAGVPEQVRADLALLEVGQEDAVDAARQQPGQNPSWYKNLGTIPVDRSRLEIGSALIVLLTRISSAGHT